MVVDDETVGIIALAGLSTPPDSAKTILHLVSQIGSVAVQNVLAYHTMKRTADMDGLTRLFAKQYMTVALGECVYRSQQKYSVLSIFLFDIDNFKNYNDTNGHVAGDKLLQQLGKLVTENTRQSNIVGRVGGEEFLVIMPDTNKAQALKIADDLRTKISSFPFANAERQPLGFVSISGGVASCPQDSLDSAELLRQADRALYRAKESGRNRVLEAESTYCGETDGEVLPLIFETLSNDEKVD
jgi:diguanylate cyclase (GGDEF)-like protein